MIRRLKTYLRNRSNALALRRFALSGNNNGVLITSDFPQIMDTLNMTRHDITQAIITLKKRNRAHFIYVCRVTGKIYKSLNHVYVDYYFDQQRLNKNDIVVNVLIS